MRNSVQTIERTSKTYKGMLVIGWTLGAAGVIGIFSGQPTGGLAAFVSGVAIYTLGKMLAWWNNG